jgi:hypothetical protein
MLKSKNVILVHGMSRAGQHPIIDWVYNQFDDDRLFLNYMFISDPLFFERRSQYYFNGKKYFYKINPNWEKYNVLEEKLKEFESETPEVLDQIDSSKMNLLMMNFENVNLYGSRGKINEFNTQFELISNFKNLLVVRDIFNYLASKIKMGRYFHPKENIEAWKTHAREYLGETDHLVNKTIVNFNQWTNDQNYRKIKSEELGCDTFLPEWNQVSSFGGGSSFNFLSYKENANKMAVLERWEEYQNNEQYRELLKDKELLKLSDSIFGHIPGTEIFSTLTL